MRARRRRRSTVTLSAPVQGDLQSTSASTREPGRGMPGPARTSRKSLSAPVTFANGTVTPQTIEFQILGDRLTERDEQFQVLLESVTDSSDPQAANAITILKQMGIGTIVNDDSILVTAPGTMPSAVVQVFDQRQNPLQNLDGITPYPGFTGAVRVATGDVNGDGTPDIITAAGPGGGPHIKVFDGVTGATIRSFMAYDPRLWAAFLWRLPM